MSAPIQRTLLVDDEPFARADLCYMLSPYKQIKVVWQTGTVSKARQLLNKEPVDIIFLDIQLRGGTGFDLIPFINPETTDLVILTAHEKYIERARLTSAIECILKPVSSHHLTRLVQRIT